MAEAKEPGDGQRTRDPREREELKRITGEEYVESPAAEGDEASSDDPPLTDTPRREQGP
jgi:hypothetical protein